MSITEAFIFLLVELELNSSVSSRHVIILIVDYY